MLQEAYLKLYNDIDKFKFKGSFEGWMRKLFIHSAIDFIRKKKKINFIEISPNQAINLSEVDHNSYLENMDIKLLIDWMQKMPEGYRAVLNLYAVEGYRHKEIAEILNISEATSRSQYMRAKTWLQNKITRSI